MKLAPRYLLRPPAAVAFGVALATTLVGCVATPPSRLPPIPELEPLPAPSPTPSPPVVHRLPEPDASPTPPTVDPTRRPLVEALGSYVTPREEAALSMGDRAQAELNAGTTVRAFELLDVAIGMEPELMPLYVVRAHAFLAEGAPYLARADLERAAELHPDAAWLAEIIAVNGAAYELEGRTDVALVAYRRALRIFSANQTAREALQRLAP